MRTWFIKDLLGKVDDPFILEVQAESAEEALLKASTLLLIATPEELSAYPEMPLITPPPSRTARTWWSANPEGGASRFGRRGRFKL